MPILGVLVSLTFVISLDAKKLIAGAIALVVGAGVYLVSKPR